MDIISSNLLLTYVNIFLILILVSMRIINSTKRHQQWLLKSFLLGLGLGPLVIWVTNNSSYLKHITVLSGSFSYLEIAVFSGLAWAIAATWLISIRLLPSAIVAIQVNWIKVLSIYLLIGASLSLNALIGLSQAFLLISTLGIVSIILAATQTKLLAFSAITGLMYTLLGIVVAYLATNLNPSTQLSSVPIIDLPLNLPITALIGLGILALSSQIISRWWFNQPQLGSD
jgi:hypothetical protein